MTDKPRVHASKHPDGLAWAEDAPDADRECGYRRTPTKIGCPVCRRQVLLHCLRCKIQMTACLCTMLARMEPLEAYRSLALQVGQDRARAEFKKMGYDFLYLPGIPR